MNSHDSISRGKSAKFIGKLLLRALGFALLGAIVGGISGVFNGAWSGALAGLTLGPGVLEGLGSGAFVGMWWASYVGVPAGAAALFIASLVAWKNSLSAKAVRMLAWNVAQGATLGTITGAVVIFVNFVLISWLSTRRVNFGEMLRYFIGGVIIGFVLGLFYTTIRAALREVRQQREELEVAH